MGGGVKLIETTSQYMQFLFDGVPKIMWDFEKDIESCEYFQIKGTIEPPSDRNEEYNLTRHTSLDDLLDEREDLSDDLSVEMEEYYLRNIRNGFFIEAGASEGFYLSPRY